MIHERRHRSSADVCETQDEIDHYWSRLREGTSAPGRCGWLKDKYGLSWQIVPKELPALLTSKDPARAERVMHALMKMTKLDIAELKRAAEGQPVRG